jgi:acetyl esterase
MDALGSLDPEIAEIIRASHRPGAPSYADLGPQGARAAFRAAVAAMRPPGWKPPPVHAVRDLTVSGPAGAIAIRHYRPSPDTELPVVVYCHGGGWTIGDLDTHDAEARRLALGCDAIVLSVDYRLAPEHPFPAALEDTVAVLRWAAVHAGALGGDVARLAVAGDSSGGNLAAAACLWARDHDGPPIAAQCLIYPVTDVRHDDDSWRDFGEGLNLDTGDMDWFNDNYLPQHAMRTDPYAAPLRAADLSGLPPAVVATASHDILRDQGEAYARRLEEAGVAVFARRYEGMVHSFFRYGELSAAAAAANDEISRRVRAQLHTGG